MPSLRAALWLWYRGTGFRGWQRQPQPPTVQQTVEAQLEQSGISGRLAAAGRTDRGVHARQQIVSLRVPPGTDLQGLAERLGGPAWGCAAAAMAPGSFHAQWTPSMKEYRYRLAPGPLPERWNEFAWALEGDSGLGGVPFHRDAFQAALLQAVGTRDFFAFHAASSVRKLRTLARVEFREDASGLLEVALQGSGFGRYQVRALVGGAALVAGGLLSTDAWRLALEEAAPLKGLLAPPRGLVLWRVDYGGLGPFDREVSDAPPRGLPFESLD